ncbi:hypothetical protein XELAEV_18022700mg [Xenopus laevis]|uniref:Uncharacterized protein n=1 Tax=Xenopus laevis TaxID=8355 RepID=A0A974D3Q3_XENLA|nr:hypothetical protein XELAEV_18022700mg [Xenopus laevis]
MCNFAFYTKHTIILFHLSSLTIFVLPKHQYRLKGLVLTEYITVYINEAILVILCFFLHSRIVKFKRLSLFYEH